MSSPSSSLLGCSFDKLNEPEKEGFPTLASPVAVGDALACDWHDASDDKDYQDEKYYEEDGHDTFRNDY